MPIAERFLKDWLKDMENAHYQSIVEHGVPQRGRFTRIKRHLPLACENSIIERIKYNGEDDD